MLLTTRMLEDRLHEYENPRNKIGHMVAVGELMPVRRGLYETDRTVEGQSLAPCIYGPSYLSFEYALARHGLIPEAVRTYTSATCAKRKTRQYQNTFGHYHYRDVPVPVFSFGVSLVQESSRPYWLASPEKALCDQVYKLSLVTTSDAFEALLFDDLRIDEDTLRSLDAHMVAFLAQRYRSRNVSRLSRYLERTCR